ncbi:SMC-Scp complex subunit ScpB [Stappia sp.]|uniref:SMC-Scp complex subunit ScpB n=1 Tax=Stappia sp. TaxID=1870903 RepID=UPI003C7D1388
MRGKDDEQGGRSHAADEGAAGGDLFPAERLSAMRMIEALLFASRDMLGAEEIAARLPAKTDIPAVIADLQRAYATRGVNLVEIGGKWGFRTAEDLSYLLSREQVEERRLSRAALETLAIIAYHQPVTRAEIEEIRGVSTSRGTIDVLLETEWIRMRGRRRTPGRPVTYGTTDAFLEHFMLTSVSDLPGLEELKGTGLLDSAVPAGFSVPVPDDSAELRDEEDPIDEAELFDLMAEGSETTDDRDS